MTGKPAGEIRIEGLRSRMEAALNPPDGGPPDLSPQELRELIRDLMDRQILLEKRNEDLKKRLEELEVRDQEAARLLLKPFSHHPETIAFLLDPEGILLEANELFAQRFQRSREELIGTCVWDLLPGEAAERRKGYLSEILRTRKALPSIDERNGRWMDSLGVPLLDPAGHVASVLVLMWDVTDQKRIEETLREREQFLRSIFSSIQDGISILDRDMTILQVNNAMERWYPHAMPLVGKKCWEAYHQRRFPCDVCPTRTTLKTGQKAVEVVPMTGPTGQTGWIELFAFPLEDVSTGELIGVIEYVRDISARKQAEEEKALLGEELRKSQKLEAIGTLAGGVAHEFNNLLAAILGHADLMSLDAPSDPTMRESLRQIIEAVNRGKQLTRQMLTHIRPEEAERKPLDLAVLVRDSMRLVAPSLPSFVVIREDIPDTPAVVLADPSQMQQVLMNLCLNAGHAMRDDAEGVLRIALAGEHVEAGSRPDRPEIHPGDYWKLSVEDTGQGMDKDIVDRIFDPFFTTKNPGVGTGLGLFVVHGIVRSHGGSITVRSVPGRGSAFSILLPRFAGAAHAEEDRPFTKGPAQGAGRILFVDDEAPIVGWARKAFPLLGYEATCFEKIDRAMEAFRSSPSGYDLVITDMTMPGMNGKEFAAEIKKIRPGTPVILCTGFGEVMGSSLASELGILETLPKPFTIADLAGAIQRALNR